MFYSPPQEGQRLRSLKEKEIVRDVSLPLELGECLLSEINHPPAPRTTPKSGPSLRCQALERSHHLAQALASLPPSLGSCYLPCIHLYPPQAKQLHAPASPPRGSGPRVPTDPQPPVLPKIGEACGPASARCGLQHPHHQARQGPLPCARPPLSSLSLLGLEPGAREAWLPRPGPDALLGAGHAGKAARREAAAAVRRPGAGRGAARGGRPGRGYP